MSCNRRAFLGWTAGGMATAALPGILRGQQAVAPANARPSNALPANDATIPSLLDRRFLTFNSVIRVNQIEVTRDRTAGFDEYDFHTPARVEALRNAFEKGWPGGRMTWAFSWRALQDQRPNFQAVRKLIVSYHQQYGDEITFIPGGFFANMYSSREQVNRDLHDALEMVSAMVGGGYRPRSVLAGFLAADNLRYLAEKEDIHVCQGNIWSQYAIDNGDGEGSCCYPYYPSREHFCKPAQGDADRIDCVNLDGWTCDFLAARRKGFADGFNSRMGVGPIETIFAHGPDKGVQQMLHTTGVHFDRGFELNRFAWVTNCWEASLLGFRGDKGASGLECLTRWLSETRRRWPSAVCITQGEFGEAWRRHFHDNAFDLRFEQRGSGIGGSDANQEIRWFMNKAFRLALLRDWQKNEEAKVIDLTRYDLPAQEPKDLGRNWSLMNRINQKGTRSQDKPVRLAELAADDRKLIAQRYPELMK